MKKHEEEERVRALKQETKSEKEQESKLAKD